MQKDIMNTEIDDLLYEKAVEKKIDHQRDMKNNIWTALIVTISGTISLIVSSINFLKILFIIIGILLILFFIHGYFNKQESIENLINKLEKR
jgi:hypothetical protein